MVDKPVFPKQSSSSGAQGSETRAIDRVLSPSDQKSLETFLRRSLGRGFRLVVIEVLSPADRMLVQEWLGKRLESSNVTAHSIDLKALPGENLWRELRDIVNQPPEAVRKMAMVLFGFEETDHAFDRDKPNIYRQLNTQRDLFARDFPCPWILFIHPESRRLLQDIAPDFSDFISRWIETTAERPLSLGLPSSRRVEPERLEPRLGPAAWEALAPELLREAWRALEEWRNDQARDLAARYDLSSEGPAWERPLRVAIKARLREREGDVKGAIALLEEVLGTDVVADDSDEHRSTYLAFRGVANGLLTELKRRTGEISTELKRRTGEISSAGEYRVRILHLSDLHERGPREAACWRRRKVLGEAWDRNLDVLLEGGAPDVICFTGDIAYWGKEEEYEAATEFFQALLERTGLGLDRLFLVPGNHDIDRKVRPGAYRKVHNLVERLDLLELSTWMCDDSKRKAGKAVPPPLGLTAGVRDQLLERQAAYRHWVHDVLKRPELLPGSRIREGSELLPGGPTREGPEPRPGPLHPRLGYRVTLNLPGRPFPIHIIGLDSSWLCGGEDDAGKLLLTGDQLGALLTGPGEVTSTASDGTSRTGAGNASRPGTGGYPLPGFRLALVHHPLTDLYGSDAAEARRQLAGHADLLLRGHQHESQVEVWADPDHHLPQLVAGCLYESQKKDSWPNSCHLLEATLDADGRPQRYRVHFRRWSSRGHWYDDDSLYEGTRQGRLTIWVGPKPVEARPGESKRHPRVAELFVGRRDELARLEAALLPESGPVRPVAVCALEGMPGVGKSYLADRFAWEHEADFPGGHVRLVLDRTAHRPLETLMGELMDRLEVYGAGPDAWEGVRSRLRTPRTLLHIENVDARPAAEGVGRLVGKLQDCPVLVTGRYRTLGEDAGWTTIEIPPLEEAQALEQLREELGEHAGRVSEDDQVRLVRPLGNLPLALHLAAGYLRIGGVSVDTFLERLKRKRLDLEFASAVEPRGEDDADRLLGETIELSLDLLGEQLKKEGEAAAKLLAGFAALGHGPPVGMGKSLGAAVAGLEVTDFEWLTHAAWRLSLLEQVPEKERPDPAWRLHPLVAERVRGRADGATVLERMTDWFVARLPMPPVGQTDEQGRRWKEVHQEQAALVHWLPKVREEDLARVDRAGTQYAKSSGPFQAWMTFCERGLERLNTPADRSNFLWTLSNVAMSAGVLDRALSAAEEKVKVDRCHGAERDAAAALYVVADIYGARGQLDKALKMHLEEQLPIFDRHGDLRERAITMGKVADIYQARGRLDEALKIRLEEELPVFQKLGDVRSRAVAMGKVADVYQARGRIDDALKIRLEEQLPVYERLGDVRSRAITMGKVADIYSARGRLNEALEILQDELLPAFEKLGDVRSRAITMAKVADIYWDRGRINEALEILLDEVIPAFEKLGDVRERSAAMSSVANIYQGQGRLDEALKIYQEELLPTFDNLGARREAFVVRGNIAQILLKRAHPGDREEASRLLDMALKEALEMGLPEAEQIRKIQRQAGFGGEE